MTYDSLQFYIVQKIQFLRFETRNQKQIDSKSLFWMKYGELIWFKVVSSNYMDTFIKRRTLLWMDIFFKIEFFNPISFWIDFQLPNFHNSEYLNCHKSLFNIFPWYHKFDSSCKIVPYYILFRKEMLNTVWFSTIKCVGRHF